MDLAPSWWAGFFAREGASVSRSFAKIFFSMTDSEPRSLAETPGFATPVLEAIWPRVWKFLRGA